MSDRELRFYALVTEQGQTPEHGFRYSNFDLIDVSDLCGTCGNRKQQTCLLRRCVIMILAAKER